VSKDSELPLIADLLGITYEQLFKALTTVTYNRTSVDSNGAGSSSNNAGSSSSNGGSVGFSLIGSNYGSYNNLANASSNNNNSNSSNGGGTMSCVAMLTNDMIQQNIYALMKVLYRNIVTWMNDKINQAHEAFLHDDKQKYLDSKQQHHPPTTTTTTSPSSTTISLSDNHNNNNINNNNNISVVTADAA